MICNKKLIKVSPICSHLKLKSYETQHLTLNCGGINKAKGAARDRWRVTSEASNEVNITLNQMPRSYIHVVEIPHLKLEDRGLYQCGEKQIQLEVLEIFAPLMTVSNFTNSTIEVNLTKEIELKCLGEGSPTPVTKWFKDDATINKSVNLQITNESLYIRNETFHSQTLKLGNANDSCKPIYFEPECQKF